MLFVGPSGIGKTAAGIQQDLLWNIGEPAFGIPAARPLKTVTIQAQDDDGDLSEIVSGIKGHLNLTPAQIELSRQNCLYVSEKSLTGVTFLERSSPRSSSGSARISFASILQAYLGDDIEDATRSVFARRPIRFWQCSNARPSWCTTRRKHTTIRALPTVAGDYVQSKFFSGGYQNSVNPLNNSVPRGSFSICASVR